MSPVSGRLESEKKPTENKSARDHENGIKVAQAYKRRRPHLAASERASGAEPDTQEIKNPNLIMQSILHSPPESRCATHSLIVNYVISFVSLKKLVYFYTFIDIYFEETGRRPGAPSSSNEPLQSCYLLLQFAAVAHLVVALIWSPIELVH